MRALFLSGLVLSAFVLGCSGTESTNGASSGGGAPDTNPNDMSFQTGTFKAPPGDSFTCFYLDQKTSKELSVSGASGQQGPGGHHILIYWTDTPRSPQHHACSNSEMLSWHQIAGSAGHDSTGAEGIINLQDGLAIKVPAGKQLVIQAHYINTTGKTETVNDTVTIHTVDPKDVKAYVNYLAVVDEGFDVPPHASLKHDTYCTVPQDFENVLFLGHMHEFGTHYRLETLDEAGDTADVLYDKAWEPLYTSHPPITYYNYDKPLALKQGTKLHQTCEWNNTTPDDLTFPREMCVGFFYYYPDKGEQVCDAKPQ